MTPFRFVLPVAFGLMFAAASSSIAVAQNTSVELRAQEASRDWNAGAARRAALRAVVNRQIEKQAAIKNTRIAEKKRKAAQELAAARQHERQIEIQNTRAAADAKKDWIDAQTRRGALRASVQRQARKERALKEARRTETIRAQQETTANNERRAAAYRRAKLRAEVSQQVKIETAAREKAAAKAKAMALITKRAREKAIAERKRADAEIKARLAALEKAKAAVKMKKTAMEKASRKIVIGTWGGGYGKAQRQSIFMPFEKQSGLTTTALKHTGSAGQELRVAADVINVSSLTAHKECKSGQLMPLDDLALVPAQGNTAVANDLIDGARAKCGVASMAWSHVVLVRTKSFKGRVPTSLKHVFDVRRYPGKRAFLKSPRHLLEMALMADGVKPDEVYATLSTYEGQSRALAKLEPLRGHIVWIKKASEAYKLLQTGKVAIASGYSGRAFRLVTSDPGIKTIWDGQIYDVDYWAIPKNSRNKKGALAFIRYATAPKRLAANARHFPYGPMRRSAVKMTGRHNVLDINLAPYLPTSKKNLRSALKFNATWWDANENLIRTDPWFEKITKPLSKAPKRRSQSKALRTKTAKSKSRRKRSTQ